MSRLHIRFGMIMLLLINMILFVSVPQVTASIEDELIANTPVELQDPFSADFESSWANDLKQGKISLGMLLVIVFLGGLLTNLTPCVYPMIPITLRLLAQQKASPFLSGGLYAAGILVTYTSLGVSASLSGSLFGGFMASKTFNVIFALIMALLGFSMLGYGNYSAIQTLGSRLGAKGNSPRNTFLMGVGAGFIASPCTGPIMAALLAYTAGGQNIWRGAFLLFVYSLGFALPYLFLGGSAARLSQIKVPAYVQRGTKVLFASVMFGLSFYYLRIPAYSVAIYLRPYWHWVAISGLASGTIFYVLALTKERLQTSKLSEIIPAVALGLGLFGLAQMASLPTFGSSTAVKHLQWIKSEDAAYQEAVRLNRPILVDAWAEWCAACIKMDKTTFMDPKLTTTLLEGWVILKIDLTEMNTESDRLIQKYGIPSLPALILLPPSGDIERSQMIGGYVDSSSLLRQLIQFKGALGGGN